MKKLIAVITVGVCAAALLFSFAGAVFAAPGDGPVNATTLDCRAPVTIPPGGFYWLKIANTPGWQVHLSLAQPPGGGLAFAMYTAEQAAKYGTDQPMLPSGIGTPLGGVSGADLNWEGHLPQGGVFYILVRNTSPFPQTLNFTSCAFGNQYEMLALPPPPPLLSPPAPLCAPIHEVICVEVSEGIFSCRINIISDPPNHNGVSDECLNIN